MCLSVFRMNWECQIDLLPDWVRQSHFLPHSAGAATKSSGFENSFKQTLKWYEFNVRQLGLRENVNTFWAIVTNLLTFCAAINEQKHQIWVKRSLLFYGGCCRSLQFLMDLEMQDVHCCCSWFIMNTNKILLLVITGNMEIKMWNSQLAFPAHFTQGRIAYRLYKKKITSRVKRNFTRGEMKI